MHSEPPSPRPVSPGSTRRTTSPVSSRPSRSSFFAGPVNPFHEGSSSTRFDASVPGPIFIFLSIPRHFVPLSLVLYLVSSAQSPFEDTWSNPFRCSHKHTHTHKHGGLAFFLLCCQPSFCNCMLARSTLFTDYVISHL